MANTIDRELQLVIKHMAEGHTRFAQALLAAVLNSHEIKVSPKELTKVSSRMQDCLTVGVPSKEIASCFETKPPHPTPHPEPHDRNAKDIIDQLDDLITNVPGVEFIDRVEDNDENAANDALDKIAAPANKTIDKTKTQPLIAACRKALNAKIDPLAVARAVVEGINPNGITEHGGNWIVQHGRYNARMTGALLNAQDQKVGGRFEDAQDAKGEIRFTEEQQRLLLDVESSAKAVATPKLEMKRANKDSDKDKDEELIQAALAEDEDIYTDGTQHAKPKTNGDAVESEPQPAPEPVEHPEGMVEEISEDEAEYESPTPFKMTPH